MTLPAIIQRHMPTLRRLLWLLMLLSHAKPLAAVWLTAMAGSPSDPAKLVALTLAALFFALKLADVAWLRFRTDVRSLVVLTVIVGVLHAESLGFAATGEFAPQAVAGVSAALLLDPVHRRIARFVQTRLPTTAAPAPHAAVPCRSVLPDLMVTPRWFIARIAAPPRAPPLA